MSLFDPSGLDQASIDLLMRRAQALRHRKDEEAGQDEGLWVAEFRLGSDWFALPLERVGACLPLRGVAAVPLAKPDTLGLYRHQGSAIAVLSLAALLGLRGWHRDPAVLLILEGGRDGVWGVDSEEIPRGVALPHERVAAARRREDGMVFEVTLEDRRLVHLVDMDVALNSRRSA